MNIKKFVIILLGLMLIASLAGCAEQDTGNGTDSANSSNILEGQMSSEAESDGSGNMPESEACEHIFTAKANDDGTHTLACNSCEYSEDASCTLNEEFVCTECAWTHEHQATYVANDDGTHTVNCGYECCSYSEQGTCEYVHYECTSCKDAYPWENDIQYFNGEYYEKGIYYAQKELNIYKYPDVESEVIGTLSVDEGVNCVGRVILGQGSKLQNFWITEDGGCVLNTFYKGENTYDMREGKTTQVVVKYLTLTNNTYSAETLVGVYDSYDAALQALCGSTWTDIKASWTYTDYKSQGLPNSNTYSDSVSGKTVSVLSNGEPVNYYIKGDNVYYYFW